MAVGAHLASLLGCGLVGRVLSSTAAASAAGRRPRGRLLPAGSWGPRAPGRPPPAPVLAGLRRRPAALAGDGEAHQAGRSGAGTLVGPAVGEAGEHPLGLAPRAELGTPTSVPARRSSTSWGRGRGRGGVPSSARGARPSVCSPLPDGLADEGPRRGTAHLVGLGHRPRARLDQTGQQTGQQVRRREQDDPAPRSPGGPAEVQAGRRGRPRTRSAEAARRTRPEQPQPRQASSEHDGHLEPVLTENWADEGRWTLAA